MGAKQIRMAIAFTVMICAVLGFLAWSANTALAAGAEFSWVPNTETDLAGYKIYYGATSREYTETFDCQLPEIVESRVSCTIPDVPDGNTFYAATAYDGNGLESDYSNEVSDDAPMAPPSGFQKVVVETVTKTTTTVFIAPVVAVN